MRGASRVPFGTRGWALVAALLVAAVAADLLLQRQPAGLDAVFGFASCVTIVVVSKWLGKAWLQRREDYYETAPLRRRGGPDA